MPGILYSLEGRYTVGIYSIFITLILRDFLLFTSQKSPKKCGSISHTIPILREDGFLHDIDYKRTLQQEREYIEATAKEMDIWLSIHPPRPGQPAKELRLIVTPFKKSCDMNDKDYRKCPGTEKCIKQELFCDGIINCAGDPKDKRNFASSLQVLAVVTSSSACPSSSSS